MPESRLPPLNTLVAFESAARLLSFKQAADELHLTPSAVSHQIKALESSLDIMLFERRNRALWLTQAGADYAALIREALNRIRNGTERVRQGHARSRLRISKGSFVANEVLVPQLASFQKLHPGVQVVLDTEPGTVDLNEGSVDVAMRFGRGVWDALTAHELMEVHAVPVCSPAMAATLELHPPGFLDGATLIHSSPVPKGWDIWQREAKVELATPAGEVWMDSYLAILRAAQQGVGVCIGLLPLVQPWLTSGQLAAPWPAHSVKLRDRYYAVHRQADDADPVIQSFVQWVGMLLRPNGSGQ